MRLLLSKASTGMLALGVLSAHWTCGALAAPITYTDYIGDVSVNIGGTAYNCTTFSSPNCAFISITATGDTSNITAFSVPGASGFKNTLQSATLNVFFNGGQTPFTADLAAGQIYVSVDQTNRGAGFGSAYGPTYPLATYGSNAGFNTYDLASDFTGVGYGPFCTLDLSLCQAGQPLYTTTGTPITISYPFIVPLYSSFSSSLSPITNVPEPATFSLLGLGLVGVAFMKRRKEAKRYAESGDRD
jgi:hypothetical protein